MAKHSPNHEMRKQIVESRKMIAEVAKKDGNEAETRRRVERMFESVMGYDPFTHLTREHAIRGPGETEHVDFAIQIDKEHGRPTILVELKRVGIDLAKKHLKQVASYAINTGCEWILLTNGREWALHHVAFGQPPVTKLLFAWNLLEDELDVLEKRFTLVSFRSVSKQVLQKQWERSRVLDPNNMLRTILGEKCVKVLRRELRSSTGVTVGIEDVISGVRRLLNENALAELEDISITFPDPKTKQQDKPASGSNSTRVNLKQLLDDGASVAPLNLERTYKGKLLTAVLRPDASIEFQGRIYDTPSAAGAAAKEAVTGTPKATDGWKFWQFIDHNARRHTLAFARDHHRHTEAETDPTS